MPQISASKYVEDFMSCCKFCSWSMLFPAAAPIQVTKAPMHKSNALKEIVDTLDCSLFKGEFDELDVDGDGYLSEQQFGRWFEKTPMRQMVEQQMLNTEFTFWTVDLNKDRVISFQEYIVLRHFWTPVLLSNTAPGVKTGTLADGPLGGLFMDDATVSVWVTTANNILLNLYLNNSWPAAKTREPRSNEELELKRLSDLDGSTRISLEEHYFRYFADIDGDGRLSEREYELSLFHPDSKSPAASTRLTFELHDLDGNGQISFMERKRIFADRDENGILDFDEWSNADYPLIYGPFQGHSSGGERIPPTEYKYYMLYHDCTVRGSLAYSRALSSYPWDKSCPLKVSARNREPFLFNPTDLSMVPGNRSELLGGYAVRTWANITSRLLWTYEWELFPEEVATPGKPLEDYHIQPPDLDSRAFHLALLTEQETVPPDWTCSETIWPDDAFVVAVNSNPVRTDLYLIAGKLVISSHFVNFFCTLFFTVLFVGHIIWILEHWGNGEVFRPFYGEGVMDGLWWSIVTQTTVGYGDKAPGTGPGKVFAIFWMLFGLIMFGVFSGQVTVFIEEETAVNNIAGPDSIAGFRVGTLQKNQKLNIYQVYGFTNHYFDTLDEAFDELGSKRIDAIVASRADIITFFRKPNDKYAPRPADVNCGNPFKIVGFPIPAAELTQAQPAVRVCGYGKGVYATTYLTQAVNSAIRNMTRDGSLAAIASSASDSLYPAAMEDDTCKDETQWEVALIVVAILLLLFYASIIFLSENAQAQKMIRAVFFPSSAAADTEAQGEAVGSVTASGGDSEERKKPKKDVVVDPNDLPPVLSHEHADEMIESAKRLGVFSAMQATDVRRMQREMKEQRFLMERMLKFFAVCSGLVLCSLAAMAGILLVIWGDQIQLAKYQ